MTKRLEITLKRSVSGKVPKHQKTAKALGLRHCGNTVVVNDSPQIRGMVRSIGFMVDVRELSD